MIIGSSSTSCILIFHLLSQPIAVVTNSILQVMAITDTCANLVYQLRNSQVICSIGSVTPGLTSLHAKQTHVPHVSNMV